MGKYREILDISERYLVGNDTWYNLTPNESSDHFDGVEFKTSGKPFFFKYRTCSTGSGWLPYVTSTENDYAGIPNRPIEALEINVYDNNGISLDRNYVVMYRVYVQGQWLSWVSNATPHIMASIQNSYGSMSGSLDTAASNAGLPGSGIPVTRIEIRIFEDEDIYNPQPTPNPSGITQRYLINNTWNTLTSNVSASRIDGIELQTSGKPYYLKYRTYTTGSGWLPYVTSTENDYAGIPGKAIEALEIKAYDNFGNSLDRKYVVMYRVFTQNQWLSWVSNAAPDIMQSVQAKYNLGGSLDVNGSNAGLPGTGFAINRIEIRVFEDEDPTGPEGITQRYLVNSTWGTLTPEVYSSHIDGIEIRTSGKPYYLQYKTYTTGNGWLPYVTSLQNDYAGIPNKAIEALQINVFDNNGVSLDRNYVVMYRVYSQGNWLAWVSNAAPDIMQSVQIKYGLGGILDTAAANAGLPGSGIPVNKIEVRIFENESTVSSPPPTGALKKVFIDAGHGGSDPGAIGNGLLEKDITLKISLFQKRLFENAGYEVMLSRTSDASVSLQDRTNMANAWGADLFISNHVNSGGGVGEEVWYSIKDSESLSYARGIDHTLSYIFTSRGTKMRIGDDGRDYYHVLRETTMPAILIEHGFIDSISDTDILKNEFKLFEMALATYMGITGDTSGIDGLSNINECLQSLALLFGVSVDDCTQKVSYTEYFGNVEINYEIGLSPAFSSGDVEFVVSGGEINEFSSSITLLDNSNIGVSIDGPENLSISIAQEIETGSIKSSLKFSVPNDVEYVTEICQQVFISGIGNINLYSKISVKINLLSDELLNRLKAAAPTVMLCAVLIIIIFLILGLEGFIPAAVSALIG